MKVTYVRSQLSSQPESVKKEIDPGFVNDQYWLVFPFHVFWDTGASVEDKGMQKLPLGKGSARQVVVKYPSGGLYAWRHLDTLCRRGQPGAGICLPSRRNRETECRYRDVGGLQEGWSAPCLNRPPRNGRRQAIEALVFGCSC